MSIFDEAVSPAIDAPASGGVHHVLLGMSPGLAAGTRRFYCELLGFQELTKPSVLGADLIWISTANIELHLMEEPAQGPSDSRRHVCLLVPDAGRARAILVRERVETQDEDVALPGRRRFFAKDPSGNLIEFLEFTGSE
jgi:catechol 2,3-dioxygenase-like lactoylglutathione lyase family enzyme